MESWSGGVLGETTRHGFPILHDSITPGKLAGLPSAGAGWQSQRLVKGTARAVQFQQLPISF
jgi:hypothetical protein